MIADEYKILGISLATAFSIMAYGTFRCNSTTYKDPLTKSLLGPPFDTVTDGWSISHFLFYMFLTILYPSKYVFIFMIGVGWEILETFSEENPFYLTKCKYSMSTDSGPWWSSKFSDNIMNGLGIIVGYYIRTVLLK